jgi:subtilisin family serine protease
MSAKKRSTAKAAAKKHANKAASKTAAKAVDAKEVTALSNGSARTIIYCHGIGNKPVEKKLRSDWDRALFGADQGERTRMAYWVDRQRYPTPEGPGTKALSIENEVGIVPGVDVVEESIARSDSPEESLELVASLEATFAAAEVKAVATAKAKGAPQVKAVGTKGIFSPVNNFLTKIFLADVNDFLFNQAKRNRMIQSVKDRVKTGGGDFVVIAHSQGTMVAYQALMEMGSSIKVDLFVTLGSPLGLPQVTGELKKWHGGKLPIPPCVRRWVNVARDGDVVCADQKLRGDYVAAGKSVEDFRIDDFDWMPAAHSIAFYLSFHETRKAVMAAVDKARFQPVSAFTVARDLASALDADADARVPVLIELVDRAPARPPQPSDDLPVEATDLQTDSKAPPPEESSKPSRDWLSAAKKDVLDWIDKNIGADETTKDAIQLEDGLDRYVAAYLTRAEVESLAATLGGLYGGKSPGVYRIFSNSRKRALMRNSVNTIQARTARLGYNADGAGITWAVLDTGVDAAHPHFNNPEILKSGNIAEIWDCTKRGKVVTDPGKDVNGHGTHVAGIIAGGIKAVGGVPDVDMISVAPKTRLVCYKVLGDDGYGNDAWIIKAIDHIWAQNEAARRLVIQGVNLSLGGSFDPTSFGCGDSPLCASLLRLIRQGALVVLAAGNEGAGEILVDGNAATLSLDLSIGDPANLDEAIAVGSVHPTLPHRYGTSYFSSRGPTADGRIKPDVVAPGERIWSCRSGGQGKTLAGLYIELSGTSMAAPHVSGLLAAFLSVRQEFIGYPEQVKRILSEHCTDLRRDAYHQGAGLPNLSKMLLNT